MRARAGRARLLGSAARGRLWSQPDVRRWSDPGSFKADWEKRARLMAQLVPPGARVIDVGAGPTGVRPWLDPSCSYVALDVVPRGSDCIVCDLNERPLPDLQPYRITTATVGGVLEYLNDVPGVVNWMAKYVSRCVVSYEFASETSGTLERLRRARYGWVSHYSERALTEVFVRGGFQCTDAATWHSDDGPGRVLVFVRAGGASP